MAAGIAVGVATGVGVVVGNGVWVGVGGIVDVGLAVAVGAGVGARRSDGSGVSAGRVVWEVEVGTSLPVGVAVGKFLSESVVADGGAEVDPAWQAANTRAPIATPRAQYRLVTIQIFSMKQEVKTRLHALAVGIGGNLDVCDSSRLP